MDRQNLGKRSFTEKMTFRTKLKSGWGLLIFGSVRVAWGVSSSMFLQPNDNQERINVECVRGKKESVFLGMHISFVSEIR
jgi:hypothetical protein